MRRNRGLILLLVCLLAWPGAGLSAGGCLTVTDSLDAGTLTIPDEEYTGSVTIIFLGDCTLGGEEKSARNALGFARRVEENGLDYPLKGLLSLTEGDDLTLVNLEGVLSDRKLKKEKKKFNFIGKTAYTGVLTAGSVECVTLANNHAHDYGEEGYSDTKQALEGAGIAWFGTDAPLLWQSGDGLLIGFLAANYSLNGNRFKRFQAQAEQLRELGCAAIITVMHAGEEYSYTPPSDYQRQIVSRAVAVGSCLVIGHHPHVVQGASLVEGVPVVYSLGNCSFGGTTFAKDNDALVVQATLRFEKGELRETKLTFHPISITSDRRHNNYAPVLLEGEEKARVLEKMKKSTGQSVESGEWILRAGE